MGLAASQGRFLMLTSRKSDLEMQVISPPLYRCTIESPDWKAAESDWKGIQKDIHDYFRSVDVEISFERK